MNTQYSELMGSFIRTGDYPLEANYIFSTEEALKEFYSDELNATTLHKGLLKIVEQDENGDQTLFWVTKKEDKLEFTKLISGSSIDSILEDLEILQSKLEQEIKLRQNADDELRGTSDPEELPEDLENILNLANAIIQLREDLAELSEDVSEIKSELKATVGTEEDDIISYLETLDYSNLTKVSEALHHFLNTIDDEDTSINTLPELKEFLRGFEYTHNLYECFVDFWNAIEGTPTPNTQFRTLRGILDFVEALASVVKNRCDNLQTELDLTQVGVGLSGDGSFSADLETYYLKNATSVMNALKTLDGLINEAINNVNLLAGETESTKIDIIKEKDKTTIYAKVKLASESGNDIQLKNNGLYHNVDSEYKDGILTIKVNGEVRLQHVLGLSMIVENAYYDPNSESIIIIFKLQSGDTLTVTIPAAALISEWEIDNSRPEKVVELEKIRVEGPGADKLSADVRLSTNSYNILKKDGNTLLVDGRASNIIFNGDVTVESKINDLVSKDSELLNSIQLTNSALNAETERALKAESDLQLSLIEETHNRELSEQELQNQITNLDGRVSTNETNISNLLSRTSLLESGLQQEINDRTSSDLDLQNKIDSLNTRVDNNDNKTQGIQDGLIQVNANIQAETDRAKGEEQSIRDLIRDSEHIYNDTKSIHFDKQGNIISADIKVAGGDNNIIKVDTETSGIYATVDIGYNEIENKIWLITSAGTTKEVQLSEGNIIDDIYYDVNEKTLVLTYTANGVLKLTKFPVADLFNDWIVKNPTEGSAIELHKEYNVKDPNSNDTPDTLSARLLIADIEDNAAKIVGNALYVSSKTNLETADAVNELKSKIDELNSYTKEELAKKLESVQLIKNDDLSYILLVDGVNIGTINIPKDLFLQSVTLNGNVLHFVFVTSDGFATSDIDLTQILKDALESTVGDVTNIKTLLDLTVLNLNSEITRATHREDLIEISINSLDSKITSVENNIKENVNSQLSNLSDKLESEISRSTNKDSEHTNLINSLSSDLNTEISRATAQEGILKNLIDTNNQILTEKTNTLDSSLNTLKTEVNASLDKKIEKIELLNPTDLTYTILVDGSSIGTIKIPEDQYFISAELIGNVIRLSYKLNSQTIIKDIDLSDILRDSVSGANGDISNLQARLNTLSDSIQAEITRATNRETALENAILREIDRAKDEEQDILDEVHHLTDRFEQHTNDFNNPHRVNKEDVGLGNVDNTSDLDKPISDAVQRALDDKANKIHTHTKSDIIDLEDMPVVAKGFVNLLSDLPSNPAHGDQYVLITFTGSGSYGYTLVEYDAPTLTWKQKLITTGGIACIIDKNIWKLNSTGPERILDASDYKYFYNKIYDETKDLIEDIDWEEDDTNDTNGQIRLKITYKTKYGNPDSEGQNEVTNPYQAKAVKYIDIDKARFLANAYTRPASLEDVEKGYAKTLGEPMLILVFTTGDHVAISLQETMNIYDEIDTDSIELQVTDWTGDAETSYKIKADLNIASTKGQEDAISLHINPTNGDKGLYATLHTETTSSITLNPSTGTSGLKYLTADLKIDNSLNEVNDVKLTITSSGLSAQIIVGEYD